MAAPGVSYVQLPLDTSNTGKKNRTQTKVVGTDTVHEHFMVPAHGYTLNGRFVAASTAPRVISATSQTPTTSGYVFLHMSTAATGVVGILRRVDIGWGQVGTAVISQSAPLITVQKYTFNVAHSGTTLDILPMQTGVVPAANVRSAPTGATVTAGGVLASFVVPSIVSTVGSYGGYQTIYDPGEQYRRGSAVEFSTGEGIVVWQPNAGTASDTRAVTIRLTWDEIDVS